MTIALIAVILTGISFACFRIYSGRTEGIEDVGIVTGGQNNCIAHDKGTDIVYIGTHDNKLFAFKDGEELWHATAEGPFSELVIRKDQDLLYGGNENGYVYAYSLSDGELKKTVSIQRRVVGLDVSPDGSRVAVATNTGSSKANILIYSTEDGSELYNNKATVTLGGIKYASDGETVISINKRGEIDLIRENGEKVGSYKTNFAALQLVRSGDMFWTVCKDGSYYGFDESLNILRSGKVSNSMSAVIASIGADEENGHVVIGSDEGFFFIMNDRDKEVYSGDVNTHITAITGVGKCVYMTGLADMVKQVYVDNLENINSNIKRASLFRTGFIVFAIIFIASALMAFDGSRTKTIKFLKTLWRCKMAYVMLLPTLLLIWFFNYRGIATAFIRAFTNWSKTNTTLAQIRFIGLDNFKRMFTEGYFLVGFKNMVLITVTGVIKVLTMPILVAWLVYSIKGDKRKFLHRFLFVLPIVVPGVIGALTWQKIYDPSIGLLNEVLGAMHLDSLKRVWLGDAKTAIWAVIFMGFPFVGAMAFLVYYGGLINIGKDVEESAMIDGATRHDLFWKIQLPLIRPQLSIMITLHIIGTIQDFNGIFILTGGGPGTSTYVPALELYLNVAQFGRYGYACALGVVLFLFTMTATLISRKLTEGKE
ncbi:MAG: ABC transporter permease subunit [Lachnospiraceae bacterium]|nr:ABC transporter permease subunit [Lachnospiraceae bacterium]